MRLRWTRKAKYDLNTLYEYYYLKSPRVASRMYNSVLEEAERLLHSPNIGVKVEELSTEKLQIHSLVILNGLYKLLYATDNNKVAIYRICSCRQNPESTIFTLFS
ncbi:plasmid stabilization system protein ParE [Parabacteroides sp. PF5-5]|uniref:type II toxin-antitoxin system RelE/ParE family toxin n=1 Tax=Parabacteroides sp. PH5-16 TaxID=2940625 RepID=UPI00247E276C|nr:plasmid stabilization system protein ParE [Parabacteroides sp. PH5-39]MDH6316069.1 plasmid stabilization system protein ParE [Parabacteroides sp. PF5-13]MDH6319726.1 plasmid stabilization system protein ParE [Parabacteroides sp. PH5-13]MDH6323457.1 plasmid stabilization system protein ParE [Parabacteroides sp. PH5-8]MDH6327035.1 plasmid stabilization system protein ParE [Parabacteroides sp. PH5-41]MDH6334837.1 plasmid stabilization system protein ParE [Parabacteroides sp. PF5-5]MDH6345901.